jgi:CheY-like chemotaxis protein
MDNLDNKLKLNVLLIEDNPADVRMIQEVMNEFKIKTKVYAVNNGVEALKFLNKKEKYENNPDIDLILLDLNIPLINGFEVLKEIRANDKLKDTLVFVLTISHNQEDFFKTYELQANCFMSKPLYFDEYEILLQHIEECWLNVKSSLK